MCIICQNRVTLFGVYWLLQRGGGWHIVRAGLTGYLTELQLSSMSPTAPLLVHTIGLENICFRNLCNICAIYVIHVSNRLSGCQQNWVGKYFCIFCNICCMCTFFLHTAIFLFMGVSMQTDGNSLFGAFLYNIVQKYLSRSSDFVVVLF